MEELSASLTSPAQDKSDVKRYDAIRRNGGGGPAGRTHGAAGASPPATPAPRSATPTMTDAELADHNEDAKDAAPAEKGLALKPGTSGGAGGGYGGRKSMRASGGGGKSKGGADKKADATRFEGFDWDQDGSEPASPGGDLSGYSLPRATLGLELAKGDAPANGALYRNALIALGEQYGLADGFAVAPTLRKTFSDTAAFEPRVVTDATGKATVKVTLPDNLTTWRATARGISGASLVGEGRASVVARRDVLVRVDAPRFLVAGDRARVPTVVHNQGATALDGHARAARRGRHGHGDGRRDLGPAERARDARPRGQRVGHGPGAARGGAHVAPGRRQGRGDVRHARRAASARWTGGRASCRRRRATSWRRSSTCPEGAVAGATRLSVVLYLDLDAAILDGLAYLEVFPYGCVEQTVHRILPAAWARKALLAAGSPDAKRLDALDETLRLTVARLRNLANDDGSYGWWRGGRGDVAMTAYALFALVEADRAGVEGASREVARTQQALRSDRAQRVGRRAGPRPRRPGGARARPTRRRTRSRSGGGTRSCRWRASRGSRWRRSRGRATSTPRSARGCCSPGRSTNPTGRRGGAPGRPTASSARTGSRRRWPCARC